MQPAKKSTQPPKKAAHTSPSNPVQPTPVKRIQTNPNSEFVSPWHSEQDVTELEETLDQAVAQVRALLKLLPTRTHRDVKKAREFLKQFD